MTLGVPPEIAAGIFAVYLLAGLVKGATGFGLPVVAVALLPFLAPIELALALNAIVILVINWLQIGRAGRLRDGFAAAWPMILGMAIMVPVFAALVIDISREMLLGVLGVFFLSFALYSLASPGFHTPPGWRRRIGFGMGLCSGAIGALTSAPGPIFVMYMVSLRLERPVYMGGLGMIMASFGLVLTAAYWREGVLTSAQLPLGLLCLVFAGAGQMLGDRWAARLPADLFRKIVLISLAVLALVMIRRAAAGLI